MANARFVLGAEVDIASGDELAAGFKAMRSDMAGMGKPKRIMRPLSKSLVDGSLPTLLGQSVTIPVGRPSAGRIWIITRIGIIGSDDFSPLTNLVGAVYIGDETNPGLSQCVRHGTVMPFTTTENENAYVVHDRETLFVNITATGASTVSQIVVNALAWEYKDSDIDVQGI